MFVYILECNDGKLYIGQTADVEKRLKRHRENPTYQMKKRLPIQLLGYLKVSDRSDAVKLERFLKNLKSRCAVLRYLNIHGGCSSAG
jgi:putative endonuclease